jgi:peptide/nickel transport system permease protein|tara:strand:+ start:189 stop:1085 length:897 start_codon:yes stop_codon:yes gene_type:complete
MAEANINFGPRPGIIGYPKRAWDFIRRWPVIPVIILAMLVFSAVFAPIVAPQSPYDQSLRDRTTPPAWAEGGSSEYLLGTDHVGRDVLSRVIHGARISLMVTLVALGSGILIGVTLGLIAGWYGGFADEILARIVDIWLALPFLLVALVVVIVFGQSVPTMMLVLAMVSWSTFVRNVRAEVLTLKTRDYVELARVSGASTPRILIRHIIPGVINTVFVIATLNVGGLILTEATLSFLGAGIPSPTPAWGLMVAEGRDYLRTHWWIPVVPGVAIALVVMSLNFLGDWLRDRFDPRLRQI